MKTEIIELKDDQAVYFIIDEVLINSEQDALDLMGEAPGSSIILHDYNFQKDFFDLSTRKLGDVMQKFANYQVRLAVIGDFSVYPSKVLPDFIRESNRQKKYLFVSSLDVVREIWGVEKV